MRLTRHNGRFGKNGVYNPKHNDRRFDAKNSEHIDPERVPKNLYWDFINGLYTSQQQSEPDDVSESFREVEQLFYEQRYKDFIEDRRKWLLSPERKASKEKREYAASQLEGIVTQIKKLMRKAASRIHDLLMKPEVKQTAKAQIKTQARESVLKKLRDYAEASRKTDAGARGSEQRHEAAGRFFR